MQSPETIPYAIGDRIICPLGHTGTVQDIEPDDFIVVQCDGGDCDGYVYDVLELRRA